MTSITDLRQSGLQLRMGQMRAWLFRRGGPVLPQYTADHATWWLLLRRLLLLGLVCFIALFYGLVVAVFPLGMLIPFAAPLAIMGLLVIWALPEAPRAPTRAMGRVFVVFTFAMLLWPNYLAFSFGGLPWISVRRLVGASAVVLLLVSVSVSKPFRSQIAAILRASPLLSRAVLGFIVVMVLSTFTSTSPGETINRFVDISITWIGMFFIALWFFGNAAGREARWANFLLAAGAVLMLVGALEYRAEHVLWANHIPSFLRIQDEAVQRILEPQFRDRYRVITTFTSPLSYGEFLALLAPLMAHKLVNAKGVWRLSLWGLCDCILLVSAFLSGARLSMVGFIVAHAVYFLLWGIRRWRMYRGGLIGPSVTLMYPALMLAMCMAIVSVDALRTRVLGGGASQQSNDARGQQFDLAVPAVAKRPLFGYGPGEGAAAVGWRTLGGQLSIDSGYVSVAADYGLLGFLSFYGAIVLAIISQVRNGLLSRVRGYPLELAIASMLAVLMTTRLVLSQTDNNPLVFMLLGLSLGMAYRAKLASGSASAPGLKR
ncbi:O-antigen ligase family protein [Sphingomonas sp. RS6]